MIAAYFAAPLARFVSAIIISAVIFGAGFYTAQRFAQADQVDQVIAVARRADNLRRKWESDTVMAMAFNASSEARFAAGTQAILKEVKHYEAPAGCSDLGPVWSRLHDRAAMGMPHAPYGSR